MFEGSIQAGLFGNSRHLPSQMTRGSAVSTSTRAQKAKGVRMTISLTEIPNFGGTDADEDALLLRSFEDHPAYLQILNHEKFCILGRKGSGKTAIFKKILKDRKPDTFSFGHTFSDYPWHHHDKQKKAGVPDEQCFVQSWTYLCLISLSKILLNQDNSQPYSESAFPHLERLERFVLDTYGTRDPDITQVFSPAHKLKFSGEAGFDWKIIRELHPVLLTPA
jgi:hypothetical protein